MEVLDITISKDNAFNIDSLKKENNISFELFFNFIKL